MKIEPGLLDANILVYSMDVGAPHHTASQRLVEAAGNPATVLYLRGAQIVLRSKTPELVQQEFFGLLMAHFAIRGLMHEAALKADEDPDQLSFLHSVRVVQRRMARYGAIPPSAEESPA